MKNYRYNGIGQLTEEAFINMPGTAKSYTDATLHLYDYSGNLKDKYYSRSAFNPINEEPEYELHHSYDGNNRLSQSEKLTYLPGDEVLETTGYTYDNNGNMLGQTITRGENTETTENTYNLLNQLTSVQTGNMLTQYSYSVDGTRTSKTAGNIKTEYVYDGQSLIGEIFGETAAQKFTINEDAEGIGITLRSTGENAGVTISVYEWNQNLLTSLSAPAIITEQINIYSDESDGIIEFSNLPAGDYVWVASNGSGGAGVMLNPNDGAKQENCDAYRDGQMVAGRYEFWIYQEEQLPEDYNNAQLRKISTGTNILGNEVVTEYVPVTGGTDALIDKKYISGLGLELAVNDMNDIQTYMGNHKGDVMALLDGNNRPIANYVYTASGEQRKESFTYNGMFVKWCGDMNQIRFAGMYMDNETKNYYKGVIYYDPGVGRPIHETSGSRTQAVKYNTNVYKNLYKVVKPKKDDEKGNSAPGGNGYFDPLSPLSPVHDHDSGIGNPYADPDAIEFGKYSLTYAALDVLNQAYDLCKTLEEQDSVKVLKDEVRRIARKWGNKNMVYHDVIPNNFSDYSLNPVEQVLFIGYASYGNNALIAGQTAADLTKANYGTSWGVGNELDAYRHGVWSFILRKMTSESFSKLWLNAHEFGVIDNFKDTKTERGTTRYQETVMDRDNNFIGITVAGRTKIHPNGSVAGVADYTIRDLINKGAMVILC